MNQESGAAAPTLAAALVLAQMESRGVHKDKKNEFHRYNYVSTEALIMEAQGCLHAHGLALHPGGSQLVTITASGSAVVPQEKGQAFDAQPYTVLILRRTWHLTHAGGEVLEWSQDWPIVPERGRPLDKATAAADTASLGYTLRDLLLLARVEKGTDLDDDSRDDGRRDPAPPPRSAAKPPPSTEKRPHDPSWESARAGFCAALGELGLSYDAVADWCEAMHKPRPSEMPSDQRGKLLAALQANTSGMLDNARRFAGNTRPGRAA